MTCIFIMHFRFQRSKQLVGSNLGDDVLTFIFTVSVNGFEYFIDEIYDLPYTLLKSHKNLTSS